MLDLDKNSIKTEILLSQERSIDVILNDSEPSSSFIRFPSMGAIVSAGRCPESFLISREAIDIGMGEIVHIVESEMNALLRKHERFSGSKTYLKKVAGLAHFGGDLDVAETFLVEAKNISDDPFVNNEIAGVAIAGGDLEKAKSILLQNGLDADVGSNLKLAYVYFKEGDFAKVEECIDRALAIDPSDYSVRVLLGAFYLNTGHCEKAIRSFRVALNERPNSSIVYVNLATAHLYLRQIKNAEKCLVKALEINPINENAAVFLADLYFYLKSPEKSIGGLETLLDFKPESVAVLDKLARAYYYSRDYRGAKRVLLSLKDLSEEASVYNNLSLVLWKNGERERALAAVKQSAKLYAKKSDDINAATLNYVNFLVDLKEYGKVVKFFRELIKVGDVDFTKEIAANIYIQYVGSLEHLDKENEASGAVEYFLRNHDVENKVKIKLLMKQIYYRSTVNKDQEKAFETIDNILKILSNNNVEEGVHMTALNNVMYAYLVYDDIKSAREVSRNLNKYFHVDPFCTATLGLLNVRSGNIERGVALYNESIKLAKHRKVKNRIKQRMTIELGKVALASGKLAEARDLFSKAVREPEGHKSAIAEAERLLRGLKS